MQQGIDNQQRLLESNGLYGARIDPVFAYDSQYQQVYVRFNVNSGPRARLTAPRLQGDLKMDPDRIIAATRWRRWFFQTWKPMTQDRVRMGLDRIRNLYLKENRLEAKVSLDSVDYDRETRSATPVVRIDAGPHIEVRTIGANLSQKTLRRYVPVFEEHAVDHDLLVEGARNLRDYFQREGYFESQVEFKEQRPLQRKPAHPGRTIDSRPLSVERVPRRAGDPPHRR